jgi:hypothetical protein
LEAAEPESRHFKSLVKKENSLFVQLLPIQPILVCHTKLVFEQLPVLSVRLNWKLEDFGCFCFDWKKGVCAERGFAGNCARFFYVKNKRDNTRLMENK